MKFYKLISIMVLFMFGLGSVPGGTGPKASGPGPYLPSDIFVRPAEDNPTPALKIHAGVKYKTNIDCIDTNTRIKLLLQECYPRSMHDYHLVNCFEQMAISIFKTGTIYFLNLEQHQKYSYSIIAVNIYIYILWNSWWTFVHF